MSEQDIRDSVNLAPRNAFTIRILLRNVTIYYNYKINIAFSVIFGANGGICSAIGVVSLFLLIQVQPQLGFLNLFANSLSNSDHLTAYTFDLERYLFFSSWKFYCHLHVFKGK